MTSRGDEQGRAAVVERLKELGVRGVLMQMAKDGQLLEVVCEMPSCYCPKGRGHFDRRDAPSDLWRPTADHYPRLKSDGGHRAPGNIRLAHRLCNRADWGWRRQIRAMLERHKSLEEIAETLNAKNVQRPHGTSRWTAAAVRKACRS